jgi:hypothetical protein
MEHEIYSHSLLQELLDFEPYHRKAMRVYLMAVKCKRYTLAARIAAKYNLSGPKGHDLAVAAAWCEVAVNQKTGQQTL